MSAYKHIPHWVSVDRRDEDERLALTLEDQLSYQRILGYREDPVPQEVDDIREALGSLVDDLQSVDESLSGNWAVKHAISILSCLKDCTIQFRNPLRRFEFDLRYESVFTETYVAYGTREDEAKQHVLDEVDFNKQLHSRYRDHKMTSITVREPRRNG